MIKPPKKIDNKYFSKRKWLNYLKTHDVKLYVIESSRGKKDDR